jgi:hypothetical protein
MVIQINRLYPLLCTPLSIRRFQLWTLLILIHAHFRMMGVT